MPYFTTMAFYLALRFVFLAPRFLLFGYQHLDGLFQTSYSLSIGIINFSIQYRINTGGEVVISKHSFAFLYASANVLIFRLRSFLSSSHMNKSVFCLAEYYYFWIGAIWRRFRFNVAILAWNLAVVALSENCVNKFVHTICKFGYQFFIPICR